MFGRLFRRSRQERTRPAEVDFELVPFEREGAGRGYTVRRVADGRMLKWETLHYSDPLEAFSVVGVERRADALQSPTFKPGSPLQLVREPDNPADPNAVAVWDFARKLHVGYVPRERAAEISDALESDEKLRCLAMWEVIDSGKRVALRALLIHQGARVSFGKD